MVSMTPQTVAAIVSFVIGIPTIAHSQSDEADRVTEAGVVLAEIMENPGEAIPSLVMEKAEAIAVFPSTIKGAFLIGVQRGKGIISVRNRAKREWSLPAFLTISSASFGIGGQAAGTILVVTNSRGVENMLQNEFKIRGEASATAGPVGHSAPPSTDIQLRADMLSYVRSRGLFAGASLKGVTIRQDQNANEQFYGSRFNTRDIVLDGKATKPQAVEATHAWRAALAKYAPNR
jgi:lipid-binding SYLF domain-containing protein